MENNKISVTPLTDEEIKEFNKEADRVLFLPYRQQLKMALDVIKLTCWNHCIAQPKLMPVDTILSNIDEVIENVDKMDGAELREKLTRDNFAKVAYDLTKDFLPQDMLAMSYDWQNNGMPTTPIPNYIWKIFDICTLINTPVWAYKRVDPGHSTALKLKEVLAEFPGGRMIGNMIFPSYALNNQDLPASMPITDVYTRTIKRMWMDALIDMNTQTAIRNWMHNNLDEDHDAFASFFFEDHCNLPHSCVQMKYPGAQSLDETQVAEICTFMYRWFLKEKNEK